MENPIIEIQGRKFEVQLTYNSDLATIYRILGKGKVRHIDLPDDKEGFCVEALAYFKGTGKDVLILATEIK